MKLLGRIEMSVSHHLRFLNFEWSRRVKLIESQGLTEADGAKRYGKRRKSRNESALPFATVLLPAASFPHALSI